MSHIHFETIKAIRWGEKWSIILDGYSSVETDFELVHYNGKKIEYKNFAHGYNNKRYDPEYPMITVKSGNIQSRRTSLKVNGFFRENFTVCESIRDGIISGQARMVSVRTVYIPGSYSFKDRILYFSGPYTLHSNPNRL